MQACYPWTRPSSTTRSSKRSRRSSVFGARSLPTVLQSSRWVFMLRGRGEGREGGREGGRKGGGKEVEVEEEREGEGEEEREGGREGRDVAQVITHDITPSLHLTLPTLAQRQAPAQSSLTMGAAAAAAVQFQGDGHSGFLHKRPKQDSSRAWQRRYFQYVTLCPLALAGLDLNLRPNSTTTPTRHPRIEGSFLNYYASIKQGVPALAAIDLRAVSNIVVEGSEIILSIAGSSRPYFLKAQASVRVSLDQATGALDGFFLFYQLAHHPPTRSLTSSLTHSLTHSPTHYCTRHERPTRQSEAKAWKRAIERRQRQIWAAEWRNVDG